MSLTYKFSADKDLYWDFTQLGGWRYGVNGESRPESYNGAVTRNMGIKIPDRNWIVCTTPNAADTFNKAAHGLDNGTKVYVCAITSLPANAGPVEVFAHGTIYYVVNTAANAFQLSATLGGAAITWTIDGSGVYYSQSNAPACLTAGAAGSLTVSSTYKYRYTWYNATNYIESDPSESASITLGAGENSVTLDIPGNSGFDTQITHVRIYRTNAGGNIYYYEQQIIYTGIKINNQASTIADTALGSVYGELDITSLIQTPTNGIPPTSRFIKSWNNRTWCFGAKTYTTGTVTATQNEAIVIGSGANWTTALEGWTIKIGLDTKSYTILSVIDANTLVLSEIYAVVATANSLYEIKGDSGLFCSYIDNNNNIKPEYYPASYYFSVDPDDGDEDSGLISCNTRILAFKKRSIYAIAGDTISNYIAYKINSPIGCIANRTLKNDELGNVLFLAENGIYFTNGEGVKKISNAIDNIWTGEGIAPFTINEDRLSDCHAVFDSNLYMCWVSSSDSSITNKVLVADFSLIDENGDPEWTIYNIDANASARITEANGASVVYFGDEDGFIYKMGDYLNDGAGSGPYTRIGVVSSVSNNTLSFSIGGFDIGGDGYKGLYVYIFYGTGLGQRRKILSNTANTLTLTSNWAIVPDTTSQFAIGVINSYWTSKKFSWDISTLKAFKYAKVMQKYIVMNTILKLDRYENESTTSAETAYIQTGADITGFYKVYFSPNKAYTHKIKISQDNDPDAEPFEIRELELIFTKRGRL